MKIVLLPEAERDLAIASDFYELQKAGLGAYFISSVLEDVDSLRRYAGIHERAQNFFRCLCFRFPFAIYYIHENDTVQIYAVLDCRQSPETIIKRLINQ